MSLSPGTRIPSQSLRTQQGDGALSGAVATVPAATYYYRGLVEGGVLGIIAGSLVTACCLALAWSHWG